MIYLGADHAGFKLKEAVKKYLAAQKIKFEDLGAFAFDKNDDYPDFAAKVARAVAESPQKNKGILFCGTGLGMGIAANKFRGVRAVTAWQEGVAEDSREHNDANVLCIAAWDFPPDETESIIKAWLSAKFSHGRHARRVKKIADIEKKNFK